MINLSVLCFCPVLFSFGVRLGSLPLVLVAGSYGGCVHWTLPFLVDLVFHILRVKVKQVLVHFMLIISLSLHIRSFFFWLRNDLLYFIKYLWRFCDFVTLVFLGRACIFTWRPFHYTLKETTSVIPSKLYILIIPHVQYQSNRVWNSLVILLWLMLPRDHFVTRFFYRNDQFEV
jgi:hypothetical protein